MGEASRPHAKQGTERAEREKRLAKALRDNLRRRKEQARARQELAKGVGIGKVARLTGLGTGTVHKLKWEMAAT